MTPKYSGITDRSNPLARGFVRFSTDVENSSTALFFARSGSHRPREQAPGCQGFAVSTGRLPSGFKAFGAPPTTTPRRSWSYVSTDTPHSPNILTLKDLWTDFTLDERLFARIIPHGGRGIKPGTGTERAMPARRFLFDKVVYESAGRRGGNSRALQGRDGAARSLRRLRGASSSGDPVSRSNRTGFGVVDLSASGRVSGGVLLSSGEAEDRSWWKRHSNRRVVSERSRPARSAPGQPGNERVCRRECCGKPMRASASKRLRPPRSTDPPGEQSPEVAGYRDLVVLRAVGRDVRNGRRAMARKRARLWEGERL